ncbi:SigE family RNA polymerase sigma factor [Nocardioides acrostichi]|uniref:SigE family RNA polymerase sigma factor n=1 Tax=Nocardioides acrostichi TaxID=2784339 RepID=A0A930Y6R7_9ACTN|nr:SigE family RNA polymerase sigma factor [Nocardioides acrostichi]MBF4161272.1 SigE family RNA polymerase sigma factor [Nocardioides acrostichi]
MELAEYVAARRTALVRSAVLLGCPEADVEDVVQATLLRCHRQWRRIGRAERPDAYVYRMLVNVLRDARARRWNAEHPTSDLPDEAREHDPTTGLAVRAALARMPAEQRDVLVLRYYADLSEADIAAALDIAPGTVKSRASRALAALASDSSLTPDGSHG